MRVSFQDYYGQHIEVNNETASGNTRLKVMTTENLNDIHSKKPEECTLVTDISLDEPSLIILIGALRKMQRED